MKNLTSFVVDVANSDKTPKVERDMTHEEYEEYKSNMSALQRKMRKKAKTRGNNTGVYVSSLNKKIDIPLQDAVPFWAIPYHKPGFNPEKTIATSGNFPLTVQAILKYFGKEVPLEDLIQIAHQGDWISVGGGTYWHFIDMYAYAYNLCAARISTFNQVRTAMNSGGLVIALLKNKLFPKGLGNHLAVITKVKRNKIFMKSTSSGEKIEVVSYRDFLNNCLALWAVVE